MIFKHSTSTVLADIDGMVVERNLHLLQPSPMETEQQQPIPMLQLEPENPDTASPLLDITDVVHDLDSSGEQQRTPPELVSVNQDTTAPSLSNIHSSSHTLLGF